MRFTLFQKIVIMCIKHGLTTETIGKIKYPMLADPNGQLARFFGVLDEASGMAYRASFIVSPEGTSNLMKSTTWVLVVMLKNLFVN